MTLSTHPTARPRRSVLYMPGSNTRALDKGRSLPADGLILDLEDAVAPEAKAEARSAVVGAVRAGGYAPREVLVRVNDLATPWGREDLIAAATAGADGIVLPKIESGDAVRRADRIVTEAGAPPTLGLWVMMETPRGILRAEEIAAASPRLVGMLMGTNDLAKDLHVAHTRLGLPMLTACSLCILVARAYGLAILDGVHRDVHDDAGFADACRDAVERGFDGKTLIHPRTIAAANAAFTPSAAAIDDARRLIAAHEAAAADERAVVLVDGKLVESLHVAQARRLVAQAETIATLEAALSPQR